MANKKRQIAEIDKVIGMRIYKLRKAGKISATKLGEVIGVTEPQLRKYEKGISQLTINKLNFIAKFFDKKISYFFIEIED